MAKRPLKRANWEFRLNDETYRLLIRTQYRTSLVIPKIIGLTQVIGCLCYFIKQKSFEEMLGIYNVEVDRPTLGEHLVYTTGLEPFSDILEQIIAAFAEREDIRVYKNQLLFLVMREYVLQRDADIRAAFNWSDAIISDTDV